MIRPGEGSGSMPAQWRPSGLTSRADDRQQDGDQRAGDGDAGVQRPLVDLEQQVLLGDVAGHPERTATEILV